MENQNAAANLLDALIGRYRVHNDSGIARRIGVDRTTICRFRTGVTRNHTRLIKKICAGFSLSEQEIKTMMRL